MDLKPNKVAKSELILEARHSKSIEASNKIRASLCPRLFIPRALQRKHLTKDANKVTTVKVKNSKNTETNTALLKNHDVTVKDQNKVGATAIFRIVHGKYTKKANRKSVLNDNAFKKGRSKTAQKETIKIKKNTNITDESIEEPRNCLGYNDMFLQYVGLTRECEAQTITQNTVKSSEKMEETLEKRNLKKRRLEQSTSSRRIKSKKEPKSSHRRLSLVKRSKIDKSISVVDTYGREPCSPESDYPTFALQKVIQKRKTEDAIISTNSTHTEKTTKSDTKVKNLKTIILRDIFKEQLKLKPLNSPIETAKNNYTRKLNNPTEHEKNNNQKDIEIEIDCRTKSQNSPQRCIQHREELKITENTSKRYLRDGDVINLDDEPDTIDLTSSGEALKNVKQSANKYITPGDFSTYWRSSCRETLEIDANIPITDQYSISSHSQESFSSHPECTFIFEDTPPLLAGDRSVNDLLSFNKNSTLVPEFQNIVRDTMSHSYTTSGQDLQINEDLMNIENSVDEFSKYLLTTFKNIKEMEGQIKQDIVYINRGEFKKLTTNTKRSHSIETILASKSNTIVCDTDSEIKSSTDDIKPEEMITILIQADQMPTKTITFKKSEIIIPTTCAEMLIETEINLLTPPPEVIVDETTQPM